MSRTRDRDLAAMASSSAGARPWRTAFLTLRDETLTSPPPPVLHSLIQALVLSHSAEDLAAAAADLPPHEVTSDVVLLAELGLAVSECIDSGQSLLRICHLIHEVCCRVRLEVNTSSWAIMLNFLRKIVECKLCGATSNFYSWNSSRLKATAEVLEIIRVFDKAHRRTGSASEYMLLCEILLCVVSCFRSELVLLYDSHGNHRDDANTGTRKPKHNNIWEMQTTSFSMIEDALSKIGPSISENLWQSLVEVLRKVMDFLASKNLLIVDNIMSRFYTAVLHCLHVVITNPKGSLSEQVTGFGATLQMFLTYGLTSQPSLLPQIADPKLKGVYSPNQKSSLESGKRSTYVPPHLRRRGKSAVAQSSSEGDFPQYGLSSSDSDLSDNDSYTINGDQHRSSKTRVAAIFCIQDLCHAEPKSLTSLWMLLLPENDVLQPRKYPATLMTCLLFDPVMKIRMASAATLASMLNGHSPTLLQVAEHKGSTRCGSFTTLSSSLGQILMQLHAGITYLIQHEKHTDLLASLFKVLALLISATPYARMPSNLLPNLFAALCAKISEELACKIEHITLLGAALSCLATAVSVSPPSSHVMKMLEEDFSKGVVRNQQGSGLLTQLIQLSEEPHPVLRVEALQVLRAVSHNYPGTVPLLWEHISTTVYRLLKLPVPDDFNAELYSETWKGETSKGSTSERCIMAAVKALDESLRAASGFKGADSFLECRMEDVQINADHIRTKKISSAPSYDLEEAKSGGSADSSSGNKCWCEVIEQHLPLALSHRSPVVRAAAVTCFAGMTSAVFFSLSTEKQEFVISSAVTAALNDSVSSVRSAACRAIGIITCFPEIICCARVLENFIHAIEFNSHDPSISVRITACWALANVCSSLRLQATDLSLDKSIGNVCEINSISLLFEVALRLTKDGDKIKSNAVRALGNLSRFTRFSCNSTTSSRSGKLSDSYCSTTNDFLHCNVSNTNGSPGFASSISKSTFSPESNWLERTVMAFLSCVTTGNVKVQWNVCHALSNLFMNDTIKLQDMSWAPSVYSILLLLLRDATNYKIRIQSAIALAVPTSRLDYGDSFCDVVQGLVHVLESLDSAQPSTPSTFKYRDNLEKQLMLTTSHVLGFASSNEDQVVKDFLVKKAFFLEEWFKSLSPSFIEHNNPSSTSQTGHVKNLDGEAIPDLSRKAMVDKVSRAIRSLIDIYSCSNNQNLVQRFEKLARNIR